jgi:hypothetical protein
MGAAQGGYIGGKLVSRSMGIPIPIIERILPSPISLSTSSAVAISGGLFGDSPDGNTVVYRNNKTGEQREVPAIPAVQWTDSRIEFDLPVEMKKVGTYTVWVIVKSQKSAGKNIKVK